jgi:hypothetical protein
MSAREAVFDMLKARLDDEHANRCLDAYRAEVLREAAAKIRAKSHDLYGSPDVAHPNRPGELAGEFYGLLDAADLIDPDAAGTP